MNLEGIHHITMITGDAPGNVDFYTRVLGLRLVAKTVNQDDPTVYHLFYADEQGSPGTEMTFFEYPGARRGRAGAGMVHTLVSRVGSPAALDFWGERLAAEDVVTDRDGDRLRFADPEGLGHELAVDPGARLFTAEHPEIPREHAIGGLIGVRAYSLDPDGSRRVLEDALGAKEVGPSAFELRGDERAATITFDHAPVAGTPGAGTVHHVAWGTTQAEHPLWLERLAERGVRSTPVIDRHYFHSIYFREPGGILYEIADDGPGFTVDLPVEQLGSKVILPPWLESQREALEARLTPLPDPRASWTTA
ncbi:MAG TPA: VOC family protein [Gaiellales bacterium]